MVSQKELENLTEKNRLNEMNKYGRSIAYNKLHKSLKGNKLKGFILTNYSLAITDDIIDKKGNKELIKKLEKTLQNGFGNRIIKEKKELMSIAELGRILRKLDNSGFKNAKKIYKEILNFWKADYKDISRKWKILNQKRLDYLNKQIGETVGKQFMYFLFPDMDKKTIHKIASVYGFAVKLADNLSDLEKDIRRGYINISKENIDKYNLDLKLNKKIMIRGDIKRYRKAELQRVNKLFKKGDEILKKALVKYGNESEKLDILIEGVFKSWLRQAKEEIR